MMSTVASTRARLAAVTAALAALAAWGCKTADPALFDRDGAPVRESEPVSYRLAVAPFEFVPAFHTIPGRRWAQRTEAELQRDLVRALSDSRVASEAFAVDSRESFDAYSQSADLLLRPRLEDVSFSYAGASDRALVSTLLWVTTWVGSLWVEDSQYNARLVVRYDLVDPHTGASIAEDIAVRSDEIALDFWGRNEAFNKGFFLSLLVPPFLTSDDKEITDESLFHRASELIAAKLKTYLKEELPGRERELLAQVQVRSPRNGSEVSGETPLRCDVRARRGVTEVQVLVNGELYRKLGEADLPSPAEQESDGFFFCPLRLDDLALTKPGKNLVRILVNVAGQWSSRSIVLYKGGSPPGAAT
jgi:hypothetical protein